MIILLAFVTTANAQGLSVEEKSTANKAKNVGQTTLTNSNVNYIQHVVQKGETILQIANRYNISIDILYAENPLLNQKGLQRGMTLRIPVTVGNFKPVETKSYSNTSNSTSFTQNTSVNFNDSKKSSNKQTRSKDYNISDFSSFGLIYTAPIDYFEYGMYGFYQEAFSRCGIGIAWGLYANYGLVDSDYANLYGRLGLTYGVALCKNIYISAPITCTLGYSEEEFIWGMNITPKLGFKFGKLNIFGGYDYTSYEFFQEGTGNITFGIGLSL